MQENKLKISNIVLAGFVIMALVVFLRLDLGDIYDNNQTANVLNSKVTIVEYSDFQCYYCQLFWQGAYKQIKTEYVDTDKVVFEYRHYPLANHQAAQKAAEASECARDQGQFWYYHDMLFARGKGDGTGLTVNDLKSYATELGLDKEKFDICLDGGEKTEKVKKDVLTGQKIGVGGTPTFFINGEMLVGAQPIEVFRGTIDKYVK